MLYLPFYVAAVVKLPRVLFSPVFVSAVLHHPARSGGFLRRWDLLSPTTFYPCGPSTPVTRCSMRRSWSSWACSSMVIRFWLGKRSVPTAAHGGNQPASIVSILDLL